MSEERDITNVWPLWSDASEMAKRVYQMLVGYAAEGILHEFDPDEAAALFLHMPSVGDDRGGALLRPYLDELIALGAISPDGDTYTLHPEPPAGYTGIRSFREYFKATTGRDLPGGQA